MAKFPENTLILTQEPFVGFMPGDVRIWLRKHVDDASLAAAEAAVHRQVGHLGHELDETTDPWLDYALDEWWELELELVTEIIHRLKIENQTKGTNHSLEMHGFYYTIRPFMEANGFRDGSGWWISDE